ncbi:MAG: FAD-dependent oxidoreductase [Balneolaceae bacterium]|nr:FAD-dependent oxidoreductase [Balneolaceae bacterium]
MFRDSTDLNNGGLITADICIVGAGIAGIALARELMDTKAEVVVLESGTFDPDSEAQSLNSGENAGLPYFDLENARTRGIRGHQSRLAY